MTGLMPLPDPISALTLQDLDTQPLSHLAAIANGLASFKKLLLQREDVLRSALHRRYGGNAGELRHSQGKDTGTVRIDAEGYVVIADLPKKTDYDQDQLRVAVETLRGWGENPENYVSTEIKVSEAKFQAWPPAIRALFEPARTVRTGKPTYRLEVVDAANAANAAQLQEVI